jgi:hypothetical protein
LVLGGALLFIALPIFPKIAKSSQSYCFAVNWKMMQVKILYLFPVTCIKMAVRKQPSVKLINI